MSLFTRFVAPLSLGVLGLSYSGIAMARDTVVIPLYSPNINAQKVGNITSLITSEVDFAGRYDMVSQADVRPKSLTPKCLKSVSCLKAIATKEGTTAMIAGSVVKKGGELEFYIVMYENAKIIRLGDFKIEDNPMSVADNMGAPIQELITGKIAPKKDDDAANAINENDFLDEEEDIFGGSEEESLNDFSLDESTAAEETRAKNEAAAKETRRMKEEATRLAAEQKRAAEQKQMEEEASRLTETSQKEEDFDFDFAPSTIEVVTEDANNTNSSMTDEGEVSLNLDSEPGFERPRDRAPVNFDSPSSKKSQNKTKTTKKKKPSGAASHIQATASIMGKVGVSNFQGMDFVTYGGEIGVHLNDWIALTIAGEGYATQQTTPILDDNGNPTDELTNQWSVILPLGFGTLVHFPGKIAKPYAGAEVQIIPSYVETGSGIAYGLRARAGSNFMLTDNFGFNLNLAAGFWSGQQFTEIEDTDTGNNLLATGFLPQLSVGTLVTF